MVCSYLALGGSPDLNLGVDPLRPRKTSASLFHSCLYPKRTGKGESTDGNYGVLLIPAHLALDSKRRGDKPSAGVDLRFRSSGFPQIWRVVRRHPARGARARMARSARITPQQTSVPPWMKSYDSSLGSFRPGLAMG